MPTRPQPIWGVQNHQTRKYIADEGKPTNGWEFSVGLRTGSTFGVNHRFEFFVFTSSQV